MLRNQLIGILVIACLALLAAGIACGAETVTIESKYPGLSSGPLRAAVPGPVPGALLEADGVKITAKDLNDAVAKLESPAKEQYRTYQFALLQELAVGKLIEAEAQAWGEKNGVSGDELMRKYVNSLVGEITVSDEEARKFYAENSAMMGKSTYEQVESAIKSYLREEKGNAILEKHVAGVSERHAVRVSDVWARMQYARWMKNPVEKARRSGMPAVVKFGADTCQPCLMMAPILKAIENEYEGKLVVVDINVDKEPVLGVQYGAESIPLLIYYDKAGKEVSSTVGYQDKADLEASLAGIGVK